MTTTLLPTASGAQTRRAVRVMLRPHRRLALAAVLVPVVGTAAGLLVPRMIGHVVDVVRDGNGAGAVTAPVIVLALGGLAQAVLTGWGSVLVARLGETMLAGLRERVVDRALRLPLGDVERAGSGDLVARVSGDVSVIANAVRTALPALAGALLTVVLTVAGLAVLDWRFAIAGLLAVPIQLIALRWYLRASTPVFAEERIAEGARTQQLLDSVGGSATVRTHRLGGEHAAAVESRSWSAVRLALRTNYLATRFFGRLNGAEFVGLAAILAVGYWLVDAEAVSVGAAAAAALYFHRLFDPINTLLGLFGTAQEAAAGLARLVGVADSAAPAGDRATAPTAVDGPAVELDGVSFAYVAGRPVLSDVRLDVRAGEHVALVGASGAGKTTIATLVAGVRTATAGHVRVAGRPIGSFTEADLRRTVALVTQEVHVFAGPLADDLRLARPAASDAELHHALDMVDASTWVSRLPDGLATVVGEGGHELSTTQAQQLALARLILADPPVAVLDEATADAGSAGARQLDRAAGAALSGRSALIVAHRLSQAAVADRIVVLDAGRVIESGTHARLSTAGGTYAELWRAWSSARSTVAR